VIDTMGKAQAGNTVRSHASRISAFRAWLTARGMQLIDGVPVPAPVIVVYLNDRWASGRKMNTISADIAGIAHWHTAQGMESPSHNRAVMDCLAGLRRKTAEAVRDGEGQRKAGRADAAISDVIVRIVCAIDAKATNETIRLRDRAMILLGFAMGSRRSELAALRMEHIEWQGGGIIVSIFAGKTGDRQSEVLAGGDLCAVAALRAWIEHAGIKDGPIFRPITITPRGDRKAVIGTDAITGQVVNRSMIKWAQAAGLPSGQWTGHSLRAGFTVQGVIDGRPESELRAQTGQTSSAWFGYAQRGRALTIRRNAVLRMPSVVSVV